jgi:imidazolonepropionase-like amidohydrolase
MGSLYNRPIKQDFTDMISLMPLIKILIFGLSWSLSSLLLLGDNGEATRLEPVSQIFKAGRVITIAGDDLSPGAVWVKEGKIAGVAAEFEIPGAEIFDFGPSSVLMPGLIDAYSQAGLSSSTRDERTNEVTPTFRVHQAIDWKSRSLRQAMAHGITTACITPGTENVFAGIASIVKTDRSEILQGDGPLVANLCSDPTRGNRARQRPDSIYVRQPTNRMGVVWIIRSSFDRAKANQDESADPDHLDPLREVVAGTRNLLMISRTFPDMETAFKLGAEFSFKPVIVGGQESFKMIDRLVSEQAQVILTPVPTGSTSGIERTEICLNRAGQLAAAGVPFCLSGTDLLLEASFAVRHGLDPQQALAAITISAARILGINDRVGSLEVGKDADLIVLNGDPLELTTRLQHTLIGGRRVGDSVLPESRTE